MRFMKWPISFRLRTTRVTVRAVLPRVWLCPVWQGAAAPYHTDNGVHGYRKRIVKPSFDIPPSLYPTGAAGLYGLVSAYREHGHRQATVDPLNRSRPNTLPELDSANYGLANQDTHDISSLIPSAGQMSATTEEVIKLLTKVYCGPLTAQFMHIECTEERAWFLEQFESRQLGDSTKLTNDKCVSIAKLMLRAQAFDHFLASKFTTTKRYGGEGAESAMVFYDELFSSAARCGISDVITCIAHRGRLNLLACLLKYPLPIMFRKMKGKPEFPADVVGSGDVLSHLTASVDLSYDLNHSVHVTMVPNPSHLEAVNPVAAGKTRARMQLRGVGEYSGEMRRELVKPGALPLCFQIHGDAAFSAQGIVAETFELAYLPHYDIGGTIHLIINNQVGYTTEGNRARSTAYSSDVGRIIGCPVLRVNADHPECVAAACQLAMSYREKFGRDIVVDYICYRRWGHNELDEPAFTQPLMYKVIRNRPSIPDAYADKLIAEGKCRREDLTADTQSWTAEMLSQMNHIDDDVKYVNHLQKQWKGFVQAPAQVSVWDTGVPMDVLRFVGAKSVTLPAGFNVHPTLTRSHVERRLQRLRDGTDIDWATAEALAFGSLIHQGFNVRISGQDVGRGTFSQRHAMFVDQESDEAYIPLNHMYKNQPAMYEVCNSPLSEEAVLAFEYGFSIDNPRILPIWEAQFGDFYNGAQIIIDTFITGGETKWLLQSALTMVLPHGMDGAGPEHSSCHIERFLTACDSREDLIIDGDDVNIQVANPTTPAQYFHLLRRQMVRNFRKPLIVAGPKVLLRLPAAVSTLSDMDSGTSFRPIIADNSDPARIKRVLFVSGKHYYTLEKERSDRKLTDTVAIIRVESLCPFPAGELCRELDRFKVGTDLVWSQEEHQNAGAWSFIAPRFEGLVGRRLRYVGRGVGPTPATGVGDVHKKEAEEIVRESFANL